MKRKVSTCGVLFSVLLLFLASVPRGEQARKVNLNTATLTELDTLPGIGSTLAERILEFRSKNGPFRRAEDLLNVRGIGEKKFLKLRDRITVQSRPPTVHHRTR